MRPKPRDTLRPKIFQSPAAAAAAASVTSAYALSKSEKLDFVQLDDINSKPPVNGHPLDDVTVKIHAIKEEKRLLELSIAEVRAENSKLGGEIDEVNNVHAELSKVGVTIFMWGYPIIYYVTVVYKLHIIEYIFSGTPVSPGTTCG